MFFPRTTNVGKCFTIIHAKSQAGENPPYSAMPFWVPKPLYSLAEIPLRQLVVDSGVVRPLLVGLPKRRGAGFGVGLMTTVSDELGRLIRVQSPVMFGLFTRQGLCKVSAVDYSRIGIKGEIQDPGKLFQNLLFQVGVGVHARGEFSIEWNDKGAAKERV